MKVLIAGGGTGGHVFPMIAVADALRAERSDVEVAFVGTGRGIEARVVPERGDHLELLDVLPLRGGGLAGAVRGSLRALAVIPEARRLVRRLDPDVVFSVGGYAAGPIALAARSCGVPVTLLEPNAVVGFTNRLLAPLVRRAYVAFPEAEHGFSRDKVRHTGVPLRSRFSPQRYRPQQRVRVLVMGGSQGAKALNETLPHALAACVRDGLPIDVVHQTGREKDAEVRALYSELAIADQVQIVTFIDDVAAALAAGDIVVERAGAGSLAELCAVGRPAILVPYPYAADDHQRRNAESLQRVGAAVCVPQADATADRLEAELRELISNERLRIEMAERATSRGRPDAARTIALDLLELAATTSRGGVGRRRTGARDRSEPRDAHRMTMEVTL